MRKQSRGDHFISTIPELQSCRECGQVTVVGIADGMPYRVEPWPATAATELEAVTAGVKSFSATGYQQIIFRSLSRMRYDRDFVPVLLDHVCGQLALDKINQAMAGDAAVFLSRLVNRDKDDDSADALITLNGELGAVVVDDPPPF